MSEKIFIYILGAGASAGNRASYNDPEYCRMTTDYPETLAHKKIEQVIPVVYDMPRRIELLNESIQGWRTGIEQLGRILKPPIHEILDVLKKELNWFRKQLGREPFVDILAETLYYTNLAEYKRLINVLTIYLILEQMTNGVDLRYKSFITNLFTLSKKNSQIPTFIKFFSWNYDYQFEEALIEKRYLSKLTVASELVKNHFINLNMVPVRPNFILANLNGSVNNFTNQNGEYFNLTQFYIENANPFLSEKSNTGEWARKSNILYFVYDLFVKLESENYASSIQFAWDDSRKEDKSALDKIVIDRSVAVSIGYSFPP
jgi:hypothetical protein